MWIFIIILNAVVTYMGLRDPAFFNRYAFRTEPILVGKDYKRLVTSGFLHVNWTHFGFNMLTLYFFSSGIESGLGILKFLLIYMGSLLGGNLFALYIHRNNSAYSAVGASGAISGIVLASIALIPGMRIGFFFIPIPIPAWIYGLFFVIFSIYGIRSQRDNIGHEAHLGGGLVGLLLAILMHPASLITNLFPILAILIPSVIFLYIVLVRPDVWLREKIIRKDSGAMNIDDRFRSKRAEEQTEIDHILDKISKKGMDSLSEEERNILKRSSR